MLIFKAQEIKKDFPIFAKKIHNTKNLIYFDNAATTQRPKQVIEALNNFYSNYNANVHRAVYTLSYQATVAYENAHKKVAKFINAESYREIIFTRSTTESLNLLAYSLGLWKLKEGDEILISLMEHHSNIVPWQQIAKLKNLKLKFIPVDNKGEFILDDLEKLITEKTKIVSITGASNVLGTINPVKKIFTLAKKNNCLTILDAAQLVPHIKVDVQDLNCDFLVASGHKLLAPFGIGFLYGKRNLLEEMQPFLSGGDMITKVTLEGASWNELPWKFEAGTPNVGGGIALGEALDYLTNLDMQNVFAHEVELTKYALNKLSNFKDLKIYGKKNIENRLGVISFNLKGVHPHDIASSLDEEGIAARSGHHCAQPLMNFLNIDNAVRISFYIYNDEAEIDYFIKVLEKAEKVFKI